MIWAPDKDNVTETVSRYAPSLRTYANSLAETYDQKHVPFFYAHPKTGLVEGIGTPPVNHGVSIEFGAWPKSFKDIAIRLGTAAAEN